jgi:adenine-specific DNA glycosylase
MAAAVTEHHRGEIPATMEELVELPGVGRKTANVVLGHALGVPGLPVDRHVLRVSNRIGIARGDDPEIVEQQLCAALPPAKWTVTSDTLILHGRRICKPRPLCDRCAVRDECNYYRATLGVGAAGSRARGSGVRPSTVLGSTLSSSKGRNPQAAKPAAKPARVAPGLQTRRKVGRPSRETK